jgi:cytochrome P450
MSAGTDTSATALEWAMMHLVLDPAVQERLYDEVVGKVGKTARITEADVETMPYLQVKKNTAKSFIWSGSECWTPCAVELGKLPME